MAPTQPSNGLFHTQPMSSEKQESGQSLPGLQSPITSKRSLNYKFRLPALNINNY